MSQKKIMDFFGSGELLCAVVSSDEFRGSLFGAVEGRKVTMMIFAEDDKTTLQGNDLSVQFDEERIDIIATNGNCGEHYQPKFGPSADGWIAWRGGVKPVASEQLVSTKWSNGDTYVSEAGSLRWRWVGDDCIPRLPNIVAYKLVSEFRQEICGLEA